MAFTADKVRQGVQKDTGYSIDNSLRFNDDDSAYLSWTPGSAGNRKTWTWSGWYKMGNGGAGNWAMLFGADNGAGGDEGVYIRSNQVFMTYGGGSNLSATQVLRDPSAWYHLMVVRDTTLSTAGDRVKMYINGNRITDFGTETYPSQNAEGIVGVSGYSHEIMGNYHYVDGYLAEVHFIDGQALDPTSFGETGTYGEWKPIEVTGMTYGTNGFYLDFSNSGSLGTDASSNTNNWTVNNLAATDQMLDSPTNNFCTWNPLMKGGRTALSEGNLKVNNTSAIQNNYNGTIGTQLITSGKWYWEHMYTNPKDGMLIGMFRAPSTNFNAWLSDGDGGNIWVADGAFHWGSRVEYDSSPPYLGITVGNNNILQIAFDADTGDMYVGVNGTWANSGSAVMTGISLNGAAGWVTGVRCNAESGTFYSYANFGQDSSFAGNKTAQGNQDSNSIGDFYYTPPTGFLALCTSNLPDPAVIPSEHFNTVTYTGTENASVHGAVTGVGFQPDMIWFKNRNFSYNNAIYDALRGTNSYLVTNSTGTEVNPPAGKDLTSFDSDGFSLGTSWGAITCGKEGSTFRTYVAWNWKAGGTGVSNTNGSITSTVSANADAGFSIVSYTGTGSNATIGHGLSKAPEMLIIKNRDQTDDWIVYHEGIGNTSMLRLNTSGAKNTYVTWWNNTSPTSTVFTVSTEHRNNASSEDYIAYCFHSVDGYSKMGSYTGNDSSDGTFIYTGFRPKYLLVKRYDSGDSWFVFDDGRDDTNVVENYLSPDLSSAETNYTLGALDFVSNGVKMRKNNGQWNGATNYIYLAFAEYPFKHTNAR